MARLAFLIVCCNCFVTVAPAFPPAYADYDGKIRPVAVRLKATALMSCVDAGMGPNTLESLFGPPTLLSRFNKEPMEFRYSALGVIVHFPVRSYGDLNNIPRLKGTLAP